MKTLTKSDFMTRLDLVLFNAAMNTINLYEAKTHFSKLIERVLQGETIVIGKAGKPVAKLVPFKPMPARIPGLLKGKIKIAPDFDEYGPELRALFEGDDDEHLT